MKTQVADQLQRPNLAVGLVDEEKPVSVLFIEDDPQIAEMFRLKLETDGYEVTIAGSDDGIPRTPPDLIFLDIRAPHRDRIRVLRTLREGRTCAIPVVIVSDYRVEELMDAGATLGHGEYLIRSEFTRAVRPIEDWRMRQSELD
jgi:CheY-like chemotaxis protein